SIGSNGGSATVLENEEPQVVSRLPRSNDLIGDGGSLSYKDESGKEVQVYSVKFYDSKFNRGPEEVSWSPDKKFLIFQSCGSPFPFGLFSGGCKILVANREGTRVVEITKGYEPDWKY
ncbi:MAG TPA: hypothetical protein VF303_02090, partial [Candidatus Nanoarchaeia archaeon]